MDFGTPKNMDEVIYLALSTAPMGRTQQELIDHFKKIIKDYLSQRFTVAQLSTEDEEVEKILSKLWVSINY